MIHCQNSDFTGSGHQNQCYQWYDPLHGPCPKCGHETTLGQVMDAMYEQSEQPITREESDQNTAQYIASIAHGIAQGAAKKHTAKKNKR